MSNAETIGEGVAGAPPVNAGEMKLEVAPVSDVDRAISSTKSWAGASMER
jgi:hypothetical protein